MLVGARFVSFRFVLKISPDATGTGRASKEKAKAKKSEIFSFCIFVRKLLFCAVYSATPTEF